MMSTKAIWTEQQGEVLIQRAAECRLCQTCFVTKYGPGAPSPAQCGHRGYQRRVDSEWACIGGITRRSPGAVSAWERSGEKCSVGPNMKDQRLCRARI